MQVHEVGRVQAEGAIRGAPDKYDGGGWSNKVARLSLSIKALLRLY
jgi:hypothetical protein